MRNYYLQRAGGNVLYGEGIPAMESDQASLQELVAALEGVVSAAELERVREAGEWAREAHAGQARRDGASYFEHAAAVAASLLAFGAHDPELLVAALLHDLVENTPVTVEEVEKRFGPQVAGLVEAVTKRPGETAAAAAARAESAGREALLLRLTDRLEGVRRSRGRSEANRAGFLAQTRAVHLPLAQAHFPEMGEGLREALEQAGA